MPSLTSTREYVVMQEQLCQDQKLIIVQDTVSNLIFYFFFKWTGNKNLTINKVIVPLMCHLNFLRQMFETWKLKELFFTEMFHLYFLFWICLYFVWVFFTVLCDKEFCHLTLYNIKQFLFKSCRAGTAFVPYENRKMTIFCFLS